MPDIYGYANSKITTSVQDTTFDPRAFIGEKQMSRDKEYDEYCLRAGIENRNTSTAQAVCRVGLGVDTLGSPVPAPPTSPIQTALEKFAAIVEDHTREACLDAMLEATEKAVDVAIALECEACARVVEAWRDWHGGEDWRDGTETLARAIRARVQA